MKKFVFINPNRVLAHGSIWMAVSSICPPMGLAMLAAVLENAGHYADIIDADALNLSDDRILQLISPDSTYVGITATTPEIASVSRLAGRIRAARPDITIIMGGVHPTVMHEELVGSGICDMVVRREGEGPILALASGVPLEEIKELTWVRDGNVVVNPQSEEYVDLDSLPFPAYHKLPMHKYRSALGAARRQPSISVITSRGCPGTCTFCYASMFGKRTRFMSAERILEHVALLQRDYGIREFAFHDDTFTADRERVETFCTKIIERNLDLSWSCLARVDSVSQDLLMLMKRAGCHQVGYGLESANQEILASMNKRMSSNAVADVVRWTRSAGLDVRGLFMLGNVGETEDSLQHTLDYALSLDLQYAVFNITTPFPGTPLHNWAVQKGALKHGDWSLYDYSHVILNLETVSSEAVERMYGHAYRTFYLRPGYIFDRIREIRTVDDLKVYFRVFVGIIKAAAG